MPATCSSSLDRPVARAVAAAVALTAAGFAGWLLYIENRQDPAVAACIAKHRAAIEAASSPALRNPARRKPAAGRCGDPASGDRVGRYRLCDRPLTQPSPPAGGEREN
jgi:hypothetical protein